MLKEETKVNPTTVINALINADKKSRNEDKAS